MKVLNHEDIIIDDTMAYVKTKFQKMLNFLNTTIFDWESEEPLPENVENFSTSITKEDFYKIFKMCKIKI